MYGLFWLITLTVMDGSHHIWAWFWTPELHFAAEVDSERLPRLLRLGKASAV